MDVIRRWFLVHRENKRLREQVRHFHKALHQISTRVEHRGDTEWRSGWSMGIEAQADTARRALVEWMNR